MFKQLFKPFLLLSACIAFQTTYAQAGDYAFSISTSPFTPVSASATNVPGAQADDAVATVPIGFTFNFEGAPYTNAVVSSNGFLSFNASSGSNRTNDLDNGASSIRPLVAPLWDDLNGSGSGSVNYEVTGAAPSRVFTVEWKDFTWNWSAANPSVSFQVKLYEGSDVVEFHYDLVNAAAISSPSASIGISGAASFLSVFDTAAVPVVSKVSEYTNIDSVATNRVFSFTPPSCIAPANGNFTFVSGDSTVFSWVSPTSGGPFVIDFGPAGFTQGTSSVNMRTTTMNSIGVGGLQPGTPYDFYVRLDCGSSNFSGWAGPFTVFTAFGVPYLEGFDSIYPNIAYTEGYGQISNPTVFTSTSSRWAASSSTNVAGGQKAYLNLWSTGRFEWFFSPTIDLGTGTTYQVEFDAYLTPYFSTATSALGVDDTVRLVISTDNGNTWNKANTLVTLTSTTTIANGSGSHFIASLAGYSGLIKLGFYAQSTVSNADNDLFIDNIQVRIPPTCPAPTNFSSVFVSTDSVVVSWDSVYTDYIVEYGVSGFTPNTGSGTLVNVTDSFAGIGVLLPNTTYDFYVTADCSLAGGGLGTQVGPVTVSTLCLPVTAPFVEDFEASSTSRDCWSNQYISGNTDWTFGAGSSGGAISAANGGTENAVFSSSFTNPSTRFISPLIDVSSLVTPFLTFYYGQEVWFGDQNTLTVYVRSAGSATWTQVFTDATNKASWTLSEILLPSNLGDTIQIAFEGVDNFGHANVLDDVSVVEAPFCPDASGLTAAISSDSTAALTWIGHSNASSFNVWFGPSGFRQATGTTNPGGTKVLTTTDSLYLDTLTDNKCYDYYVKTYCGATDSTVWVGPYTFCTPCKAFNAPYVQTFTNWPLSCWDNSKGDNPWASYNSGGNTMAEANFWSVPSGDYVLTSPIVNLTTASQVRLYWSHSYDATYPDDQFVVRVRLATSTVWDTLLDLSGTTFNDPAATSTAPGTFIEESLILAPATYNNQSVVVELIGVSNFGPDLFVDNFFIEPIPTCFTPDSLAASNPTVNSIDFSWVPNVQSTGNSFEISYGPNITHPDSGTKVLVTGTNYTATSLMPATTYCAFVREVCGPADSSYWSLSPVCETTLCTVFNAPFLETFDNTTMPNCWAMAGADPWLFTTGWPAYGAAGVADHTGNGGSFAGVDGSGGTNFDNQLISPLIDISSLSSPELRFWMFMDNVDAPGDNNTLSVDIYDGTTWQDSVFGRNSDSSVWVEHIIDLSAFAANGTIQVRFVIDQTGGTPYWSDIVIDDVLVSSGSPCPPPTTLDTANVTCSTADLIWASGSATLSSIVQYGPAGFTLGSGMDTAGVSSPVTLTGLMPSTQYEFYVKDVCASPDSSSWSGPFSFTTGAATSVTAAFTANQSATTLTSATVDVDASTSTGAVSYVWDFGNGTTGTGVNASATYTADGTYNICLAAVGPCGNADTTCQTVVVQGISLEENVYNAVISVYPNPSAGTFVVNVGNTSNTFNLEVTDLSGRVVYRRAELKPQENQQVNLNEAAGVYILKITGKGLRMNQRIVIQH